MHVIRNHVSYQQKHNGQRSAQQQQQQPHEVEHEGKSCPVKTVDQEEQHKRNEDDNRIEEATNAQSTTPLARTLTHVTPPCHQQIPFNAVPPPPEKSRCTSIVLL
ncbi:hypothetical protein VNO80_19458 [Phaseolus coccineus]|uniref:Uncharacterized protein n=1 Tax=Phaseolus coccineus TaxID=3886 RepID=A0AAN9QZS7_PHACN